jgi:type I restriction enzyme S subunit
VEVRPGYKQTEVGVIPEEWGVSCLSQISRKITDGDHATPKRTKQGYYLLSARNVLNGRVDLSDVDYVGEVEYQRMKQRCNPETGDILLSCSGTIGRVAVVPATVACVLVRSAALVKLDPAVASSEFIQFWLQGKKAQEQIATSVNQGAQANLFLNHIERLQCPRPSLVEQRAIAEALSNVDALLGGLDRLIAKKRDLKQAAMQQLLTGQTRLPGFNGEWEVKRLGEIAFCFSGGTPPTEVDAYYGGDIPWITSGDLNKGYITDVEGRITAVGLSNSSAKMVEADTLLIALYGATSGVTAISKIRAAINQAVLAIIPPEDSPTYLYFKLTSLKDWLISTYTQGGQPNLSGDIVKYVEFPLPSVLEQTAIATILSDMDAELAALEQRRNKTRALKQAMMQELLTGRTRLVAPATETALNTAEDHSRNAPRQMKENRSVAEGTGNA